MTRRTEAFTPRAVFHDLVKVAGDDVLIGGQALAVWVEFYGVQVPKNIDGITRDVDFLTTSPTDQSSLQRYARVLNGQCFVYNKDLITSLVGQAYKELPNEEVLNVDVLWSVFGLNPKDVRDSAERVTHDGVTFQVMHPMDVLYSRMVNLHKLPEKANGKGVMQLRLAVDVVREYLRHQGSQFSEQDLGGGRSPLQPIVSAIEKFAIDDAGRKIAERYAVHVADAIDPSLIPAGSFWERKWPTLKTLMSPDYAGRFIQPQILG